LKESSLHYLSIRLGSVQAVKSAYER